MTQRQLSIPVDRGALTADLDTPDEAAGVVVFAHGSGSSRHSPRNRQVAAALVDAGFATLLTDLLTPEEGRVDEQTRHLRFDIRLLADRLLAATRAARAAFDAPIGYFGASTGAAAALVAAAEAGEVVRAVVSRGGRPDLAGASLGAVGVPVLLIVGSQDHDVMRLNRTAAEALSGRVEIAEVAGASHLFTEPGTLEEVEKLAAAWFRDTLGRTGGTSPGGGGG